MYTYIYIHICFAADNNAAKPWGDEAGMAARLAADSTAAANQANTAAILDAVGQLGDRIEDQVHTLTLSLPHAHTHAHTHLAGERKYYRGP